MSQLARKSGTAGETWEEENWMALGFSRQIDKGNKNAPSI